MKAIRHVSTLCSTVAEHLSPDLISHLNFVRYELRIPFGCLRFIWVTSLFRRARFLPTGLISGRLNVGPRRWVDVLSRCLLALYHKRLFYTPADSRNDLSASSVVGAGPLWSRSSGHRTLPRPRGLWRPRCPPIHRRGPRLLQSRSRPRPP